MGHDFKRQADTEFSRWSERYDRSLFQRILFRPAHDLILREIGDRKDADVLDIGCGTGVFAFRLHHGRSSKTGVYGLDLSHEMIKVAEGKLREDHPIRFKVGDSECLPYGDSVFDYVACSNSFHHYPYKERVVRDMYRVLKPGGKIMIVDGNKDNFLGKIIFDIIITTYERFQVVHLSRRQFRDLLTRCGFTDIYHRKSRRGLPILLTVGTAAK